MSDNGYVYVLMNPSMDNLVKIGKTERKPQERAKELSSTTGVPTPFVVVYESYFESCSKAEEFVHTSLESKGFRISSNREFFEIPIKEAIDAVILAKNHFGRFECENVSLSNLDEEGIFTENTDDDFLNELEFEETLQQVEPWEEMFEIAESFYYGLDDEIQDYEEAMKYYLMAIKLGSLSAYTNIGAMYSEGEGVKENKNKAFQYFKEGAKKGEISCYARMAKLFNEQGNIDNSKKCWKKYFEQSEIIDAIEAHDYMITFVKRNDLELEYIDKLKTKKDGIIEHSLASIEFANETMLTTDVERQMLLSMYQEDLEYIKLNLEVI